MTITARRSQANRKKTPTSVIGTTARLEFRKVSDLTPSKFAYEIYGKVSDEGFSASIEANGFTPLEIMPDGRILAGNRRYDEAKRLGIESVPVLVRYDLVGADEHELQNRIIVSNLGRDRPLTIRDREAAALLRIHRKRAELRKKKNLKNQPVSRDADSASRGTEATGEAAEIVAKMVGLGRDRVRRIGQVVDEIDRKRAKGDEAAAAALEEIFKSQGLDAVHERITRAPGKSAKPKAKCSEPSKEENRALQNEERQAQKSPNAGLKIHWTNRERDQAQPHNGNGEKTSLPTSAAQRSSNKLVESSTTLDLVPSIHAAIEGLGIYAELIDQIAVTIPGVIDRDMSQLRVEQLSQSFATALKELETKAPASSEVDGDNPEDENETDDEEV